MSARFGRSLRRVLVLALVVSCGLEAGCTRVKIGDPVPQRFCWGLVREELETVARKKVSRVSNQDRMPPTPAFYDEGHQCVLYFEGLGSMRVSYSPGPMSPKGASEPITEEQIISSWPGGFSYDEPLPEIGGRAYYRGIKNGPISAELVWFSPEGPTMRLDYVSESRHWAIDEQEESQVVYAVMRYAAEVYLGAFPMVAHNNEGATSSRPTPVPVSTPTEANPG